RMGGGDKGLRRFAGATLLDAVVGRFAPQVTALALNANGDPARFARFGLPVLPDPLSGLPGAFGPLAGVLAALDWASDRGDAAVLTLPTDSPYLPPDLAQRLEAARPPGRVAMAADQDGTLHPI